MALDFLTAAERELIKSDFHDLTTDPQVAVPLTYQRYTGRGAFVPGTGIVETYAGSAITAFRAPISEFEIAESAGVYQVGDYRYLIEAASIGYGANTKDRIIDGAVTRFVVNFDNDPIQGSVFYSTVARDVGSATL